MRGTLPERFAAKVNRNGPVPAHRPELGPCHPWTAGTDSSGYGSIGLGPGLGVASSHRVAFKLAHGRWPEPCALHHCDNRACCKALPDEHGPAHIYEGTNDENIADKVTRGRGSRLPGERNPNARLSEEDVAAIRAADGSQTAIAVRFGVTQSHVSRIRRRVQW